jgi:hypothetical protein
MEIGDSFVGHEKATRAAYAYAKYHQLEMTVRKISDSEYRIWRTK